jgi:TonB family protein
VKGLVWTCFLFLGTYAYCDGAVCIRHVAVPGYPRLARMASLQGSVTVDFEVSPDGQVISASGSGAANRLLIRASEENIQQWTFRPPDQRGTSPTKRRIVYVYKLEGRKLYYDPPPTVVLDWPDRLQITTNPPEPQP